MLTLQEHLGKAWEILDAARCISIGLPDDIPVSFGGIHEWNLLLPLGCDDAFIGHPQVKMLRDGVKLYQKEDGISREVTYAISEVAELMRKVFHAKILTGIDIDASGGPIKLDGEQARSFLRFLEAAFGRGEYFTQA